jgi:hypothetical protein
MTSMRPSSRRTEIAWRRSRSSASASATRQPSHTRFLVGMEVPHRAHVASGARFGALQLVTRAEHERLQNLGFDVAFPHISHAAMAGAA